MKIAQIMGITYALGRQVLIPILIIAFIALAFYKVGLDPQLTPCVINTVGEGKVQYLNCDATDLKANKEVLVDTSLRTLEVLFNYSKGKTKTFASQFEQYKRFIARYSPAADKIPAHVLKIIGNKKGPIAYETSTISIDYDSFDAILENDKAYITLDAKRTISRSDEPSPEFMRVDITFTIGGGKNEVYRVYDYAIHRN